MGVQSRRTGWKAIFCKVGESVLVYDSRYHLFPGKFKSRWYGPCKIVKVIGNGAVQVQSQKGGTFLVNGQRGKHYLPGDSKVMNDDKEEDAIEKAGTSEAVASTTTP